MFAWRTGLDIADKAFLRSIQCGGKPWGIKAVIVIIIAHGLRRATEQRKIIRLTWTRDCEAVNKYGATSSQVVDKWCPLRIYDLVEGVVLEYDHHDMS